MNRWRDHLLNQVEQLPCVKPLGSLVVYGEKAWPVVHADNPEEIPFAVAKLGRGRIWVATSSV